MVWKARIKGCKIEDFLGPKKGSMPKHGALSSGLFI